MKKSLIIISTVMLITFLCSCSNSLVDSNKNENIDLTIKKICSYFDDYTIQNNGEDFEKSYQDIIADIENDTNSNFLEDTGSGIYALSFQYENTLKFTVFGILDSNTKFSSIEFYIDDELYYSYDIK